MPSFFGQHSDCKFNNDPLCDGMGSVSFDKEGYREGPSTWIYAFVIVPVMIYIVANFPTLLAYFN